MNNKNQAKSTVKKESRPAGLLDNIKIKPRFSDVSTLNPTNTSEVHPQGEISIDDKTTDEAIDDIVYSESNEALAAQDQKDKLLAQVSTKKKRKFKVNFKQLFKNKWFYISLPIIIIIALFAVPLTRYDLLGLVLSKNYQISVIDSVTNSPVGGAEINVAGHELITSSSGKVTVKLKEGHHKLTVSKDLYKTQNSVVLVGFLSSKPDVIHFVATGRSIAIKVINKLTNLPLAGATLSVDKTSSITNSKGETSLVLPTKSKTYHATLSANGYSTVTTTISLTKAVNNYDMVPSGNLFFLANNGKTIAVMKTNLDGSNPSVFVAGTGYESIQTTFLVPSPDWKYLVLEANRSNTQPELYVINTSNGDISEFDSFPDQFNLIGWSGDNFIYDEIDTPEATNTVGREELKSYNAESSKTNVLDQNQVDSSSSGYAFQTFSNFNLVSSEVVYLTNWSTSGTYDTSTLTSTIRGVEVSGANKQDFESYATPNTGTVSVVRNSPSSIYFSVPNTSTNQTTFYNYASDSVNTDSSLSSSNFSQTYPTYYLSPSGTESLWTQTVNGLNETFTGDQNGSNQKLLNSATSGYLAYGWYNNIYLLLTKNGNLYIEPANGPDQPTLIGSFLPSGS